MLKEMLSEENIVSVKKSVKKDQKVLIRIALKLLIFFPLYG